MLKKSYLLRVKDLHGGGGGGKGVEQFSGAFNFFLIFRLCMIIIDLGKAARNYSVCMGIRWQITLCKIEFYTIRES